MQMPLAASPNPCLRADTCPYGKQISARRQTMFSNDEPSLDQIFAEPIIVLLMERDGVDDHLLRATLARLSAHRRYEFNRRPDVVTPSTGGRPFIWQGHLFLDPAQHQCSWKGHGIDLTVTEYALLRSLVERPGFVKTRDQLMDAAYGKRIIVCDRTIDSHIKRLRNKFRAVDRQFDQIQTVWGVGYRYARLARHSRLRAARQGTNADGQWHQT